MKFYREHTWIDSQKGIIGITDYAQKALGDIVFTDLPAVGDTFAKGEQFGSIESVKSVSALFTPVSIKVLEVNELMVDEPEIINSDPYNKGWLIKVEILNILELDDLLTEEEYLNTLG